MGACEILRIPLSIIIISWLWSPNEVFVVFHKFLNMQDNEDTTEESHEIVISYIYNTISGSREGGGLRELQSPPSFWLENNEISQNLSVYMFKAWINMQIFLNFDLSPLSLSIPVLKTFWIRICNTFIYQLELFTI